MQQTTEVQIYSFIDKSAFFPVQFLTCHTTKVGRWCKYYEGNNLQTDPKGVQTV